MQGMLRIIQSIPSKKAEPIKVWMAEIAAERINQAIDPERSIDQAIADYRSLGYSEAFRIQVDLAWIGIFDCAYFKFSHPSKISTAEGRSQGLRPETEKLMRSAQGRPQSGWPSPGPTLF